MHQTVKIVFRLFFAVVILSITVALFLSVFLKTKEILNTEHALQHAQSISLKSSLNEQLVLVSNNKRPDQAIFILIANNGFIHQINCEHYLNDICTDAYNHSHTRQISQIDLLKIGQHTYIQRLSYQDSRTQKQQQLKYTKAQIQQFYDLDISTLRYVVFSILLFAFAALFVSIKMIRNFKTFLSR